MDRTRTPPTLPASTVTHLARMEEAPRSTPQNPAAASNTLAPGASTQPRMNAARHPRAQHDNNAAARRSSKAPTKARGARSNSSSAPTTRCATPGRKGCCVNGFTPVVGSLNRENFSMATTRHQLGAWRRRKRSRDWGSPGRTEWLGSNVTAVFAAVKMSLSLRLQPFRFSLIRRGRPAGGRGGRQSL
jgi:hypothetical protein